MNYRSAFPTAHGFDEASFGGGWVPGMGSEWVPRSGFGSGAPESPSMQRAYRPQGQERIIPITRYDGNNQSDFETESNYSGSSLASGASVGSNRSNSSSRSSGRASGPEGRVRRVPMTVEGRSSPSSSHVNYNRPSSRSSVERTGSPHIYSSSPSQHYYPSHTPTPTQLGNCHAKPAEGGASLNEEHINQSQVDGTRGPHVTRVHLGQSAAANIPTEEPQHNLPQAEPTPAQQPLPSKQKPTADQVMNDVHQEVGRLEDAVNEFDGEKGKDSKEYRYLDEMLTRCMLKLDDIDCSGRDELRQQRKSLLGWINKCIQLLESKVKQLIPMSKTPEPDNHQPLENNEDAQGGEKAEPSNQVQPDSQNAKGNEESEMSGEPMETSQT